MIYLTGHIKEGVLRFRHRKFVDAMLQKQPDGDYQITVELLKKRRSLRQLRYYWGVIVDILTRETGERIARNVELTKQDGILRPTSGGIHSYLKSRFNATPVLLYDAYGNIAVEASVGETTTRHTPGRFSEYCEDIKIWSAQDLGIVIPDPPPEEGEYHYER